MGEVVYAVAISLFEALMVMLFWNWWVPGIFGLRTINYIEALGLFVLAQTLFVGKPRLKDL